MRTNGAVAFCKAAQRAPASIRARFQSGARSKMYGEEGAKMIIHVFSEVNSIKSERRNCPPSPTHRFVCVGGEGWVGVAVCPLKSGRINKTITSTITALRSTQDSFLWKFNATN